MAYTPKAYTKINRRAGSTGQNVGLAQENQQKLVYIARNVI